MFFGLDLLNFLVVFLLIYWPTVTYYCGYGDSQATCLCQWTTIICFIKYDRKTVLTERFSWKDFHRDKITI